MWGASEAEERADESDGVLILILTTRLMSPEAYPFSPFVDLNLKLRLNLNLKFKTRTPWMTSGPYLDLTLTLACAVSTLWGLFWRHLLTGLSGFFFPF